MEYMLSKTLFKNPWLSNTLVAGMILLAAVCMLRTPDFILLRKISSHSTQIMVLFLGAGLFFHLFSAKRLLFTAFGCAAALCLYFKYASNINLIIPTKTSEPSFKVALTSTAEFSNELDTVFNSILASDPDIICFVEMTPNWAGLLDRFFRNRYPHIAHNVRVDILGTSIYSKYPMERIDTIYAEDVPNLKSSFKINEQYQLHLYASNTNPPLFRKSFEQLRNQLSTVAKSISSDDSESTITAGYYHLDQFADELQDFRALADLNDSRKTLSPSLYPPINHIFYSDNLECLQFSNLYSQGRRIGIIGEYQYKSESISLAKGSK